MFVKHDTRKVLVVGLLILAAVQQAVSAQETTANTPDGPQCRTWTDRSGKHRTEATFIEAKDGKVTLRKKDGTTINIPLDSLSDADQEYVRTLGQQPPGEDRAEGQAPPGRGKRTGKQPSPQPKEVIVTGVGTDPDKAVQNAFSQAIEQTVGLLVESETVVKNDQLIHDEILTFSRGYVERYEVIRRWQEDGLHHAKIRAVVARDKLVAKLRGIKIAVQEVSGDLPARQIEFDAKNEEQAIEIFRKAMAGFDMTKLAKVEIVGKPDITRKGTNAEVHVKMRILPDMDAWRTFSQSVRPILTKTAIRRASLTIGPRHYPDQDRLKQQLEGDGILVGLFTSVKSGGANEQWEVFRVPDALEAVLQSRTSKQQHYQLVCALQDDQHNDLARITASQTGREANRLGKVLIQEREYGSPLSDIWWVGPKWFGCDHKTTVFEIGATIEISSEDLGKLAQTVAFLEEDTKDGRHSSTDDPFGPAKPGHGDDPFGPGG